MNLEDLKISHVAVGIKETHRALEKQNVKCVFIIKIFLSAVLLSKGYKITGITPFVILIWWPATCKQGNTQRPVFVFVCTYIAVSGFVSETCFSRDNSFIRI